MTFIVLSHTVSTGPLSHSETYRGVLRWRHLEEIKRQMSLQAQWLLFFPSFRHAAAAAKSLQSCLTLCDPIDSSSPGSPIPGIFQARTLEWVAISFSNAGKWKVKVKSLSCSQLAATPWTAAYQAPSSTGFSSKSTRVGCLCLLWLQAWHEAISMRSRAFQPVENFRKRKEGGCKVEAGLCLSFLPAVEVYSALTVRPGLDAVWHPPPRGK